MLYNVYHQGEPIKTDRKDWAGRHIYEANITRIAEIDVPIGKCPIELAREKFDISCPMVSAINGYDENGNVCLSLQ